VPLEIVSKSLGIKIPNLTLENVPKEEVNDVSLGGLYVDPDLVLITPTSVLKLRNELTKLIKLYL